MGSSVSTINKTNTDPAPFLTNDLPRYIIETELPPGSGRMLRGYRIRSSECGVLLICKATVIRYNNTNEITQDGTNEQSIINKSITKKFRRIKTNLGINRDRYRTLS